MGEEDIKKKEKNEKEVKPLISIYLKDGELFHSYSEENSDIITENNILLCGYVEKIKKELLELEDEEDEEDE